MAEELFTYKPHRCSAEFMYRGDIFLGILNDPEFDKHKGKKVKWVTTSQEGERIHVKFMDDTEFSTDHGACAEILAQ